MILKEQLAQQIINDKSFRRGLSAALDMDAEYLKKRAKLNKSNSCLTLGAALEYYKANGFKSPTIQEKAKNPQTV